MSYLTSEEGDRLQHRAIDLEVDLKIAKATILRAYLFLKTNNVKRALEILQASSKEPLTVKQIGATI